MERAISRLRLWLVGLSACLILACQLPIPFELRMDRPGQVSGRVEQGARDFAVVQMTAIGPRRSKRSRKPLASIILRGGGPELPLTLMRPGEPVVFENRDASYHQLFSLEPKNAFELRIAGGGESQTLVLSEPGLVHVYCRLHPEEAFTLLSTEADQFAYVEGNGRFEFRDIPAGDYEVVATLVRGASDRKRLHVGSGHAVDLTLRVSLPGEI